MVSSLNNDHVFFSLQAIRDGVIDATIDHEKGHVQSKVWKCSLCTSSFRYPG